MSSLVGGIFISVLLSVGASFSCDCLNIGGGVQMKNLRSLTIVILSSAALQISAEESHHDDAWTVDRLGPSVNTEYNERFSMISSDGLVIYFASDRPDAFGAVNERGRKPWDMYVAWRASVAEPFGKAFNLGPDINSPYGDHSAAFSEDGQWMYFASSRPGGCGGYDLYVSYRENVNDHLAWESPQHLGCTVNTQFDEACPFFITDEQTGKSQVYLVRNSGQGQRDFRIFTSQVGRDTKELGSASPVKELNSSVGDYHFEPKHGLIWSSREGGYGASDIWRTGITHGAKHWTRPENMGATINTEHNETLPSSTSDGQLFFPSNRPGGYGGFDIYVAIPSTH